MKIVIVTNPKNSWYLNQLLNSIDPKRYPAITLVINGDKSFFTSELYDFYDSIKDRTGINLHFTETTGFELAAIKWAFNQKFESFLLLQDSVVIQDDSFFDAFEWDKPTSLSVAPTYEMYMGKYVYEDLTKLEIPVISTKMESIHYEGHWCREYISKCQSYRPLDPALHNSWNFEMINGYKTMVSFNKWILKYKRIWSAELIYNYGEK